MESFADLDANYLVKFHLNVCFRLLFSHKQMDRAESCAWLCYERVEANGGLVIRLWCCYSKWVPVLSEF